MSRVGFVKRGDFVIEHLPKNEQLSTQNEKRMMFFNLYNYYVEKDMRLSNKEIQNGANIYNIFENKISSLITGSQVQLKFTQLIDLNSHELLFDMNDMFLHLVYERIKLVNKHNRVVLLDESIMIYDDADMASSTLVVPNYIEIDTQGVKRGDARVSEDLKKAKEILGDSDIKQIYLVYPKHNGFTKHITVNFSDKTTTLDSEYRVKIIPYSFSFCTRALDKKCSKNKKKEKQWQ
jgi:hypothetical protein